MNKVELTSVKAYRCDVCLKYYLADNYYPLGIGEWSAEEAVNMCCSCMICGDKIYNGSYDLCSLCEHTMQHKNMWNIIALCEILGVTDEAVFEALLLGIVPIEDGYVCSIEFLLNKKKIQLPNDLHIIIRYLKTTKYHETTR